MITKISHIGVAVRNLETAVKIYKGILQSDPSEPEIVEEQKVRVVKFKLGESTFELLEPTSDDSSIATFIEKRGEGVHHIAYESDNIRDDLKRLDSEGYELIDKEPRIGADNELIAFIKPRSVAGVLIELCQH